MPSAINLDQRGYIFAFPALGLPDPAGEWVHLKVGIGSKERAIPKLNDGASSAPRRFAGEESKVLDVEYEGAVWLLPLCAPQQAACDTEVFTIKARRVPAASFSKCIELPNGLPMWYIKHLEGFAAFHTPSVDKAQPLQPPKTAREDDEETFWACLLSSLLQVKDTSKKLPADFTIADWPSKLITTSHSASLGKKEQKPRRTRILDWRYHPNDALSQAWYLRAMTDSLLAAGKKSTRIDPFAVGIIMRSTPGEEGTYEILFEYAFTFVEQSPVPPDEQWKRVPLRAWNPGYELKFVNQVREMYGQEPLTEDEVTWARPEPQEA